MNRLRTIRRLLYRDIASAVLFVSVAFLALFFFIDFVDVLDRVGRNGYTLGRGTLQTVLAIPAHFYELFPIAVLIGCIYAMARLAQSSEFTILRTAGLGPWLALRLLAWPGLLCALLTFAVGDYLIPQTEQLDARLSGRSASAAGHGAWLRDLRADVDGQRRLSVHVAATQADGQLRGIRIFEMDPQGRLMLRLDADSAQVSADGAWLLRDVRRVRWPTPQQADANARVLTDQLPALRWSTTLNATVVAAALLPVQTMQTADLWRYAQHLSAHAQAAQRYQIQFWQKALYPLACIVMVALALPFAYLHARAGGISYKVFGGIMLGISFVLINNASAHLGLLNHWVPWVAAAAPSALYLLLSLAAFGWLVRYR